VSHFRIPIVAGEISQGSNIQLNAEPAILLQLKHFPLLLEKRQRKKRPLATPAAIEQKRELMSYFRVGY
jgi:hypothetical protein